MILCVVPDEELEPRNATFDFVREQASELREQLSRATDETDFLSKVVKPVSTINVLGLPVNVNFLDMYKEHFEKMPGEIILYRQVGNKTISDGV